MEGSPGFHVEHNNVSIISNTSEDMVAWSIVPLPELILKALAEQNFKYPTQIQMLTLPAGILGINS